MTPAAVMVVAFVVLGVGIAFGIYQVLGSMLEALR